MLTSSLARNSEKTKTFAIGRLLPPYTTVRRGKRSFHFRSWMIEIKCPFCGQKHYHGFDPDEPPEQRVMTRESHCEPGGEYYIELEDRL